MGGRVLRTSLCDMLDIEYPILSAGMGPNLLGEETGAPAELVVAVSEAGGLGVLGASGYSIDELRQSIREIREKTDKPFGVDLLLPKNLAGADELAGAGAVDIPLSDILNTLPKEYKDWLAGRPSEKRSEPFYWHDVKWNNPLAPVVGVSWFEAEAYCNWLAKKLGKPVRLPTEEEWERAARHTDGREYPWGNTFERNRLNCAEFWAERNDLDWNKWLEAKGYEIASTTLVGQFTEGNSIAGISDMSGNVWEWTNSWYNKERRWRTVRGGSWNYNWYDARCAYRGRYVPDDYDDSVGFRVVSPGSISGF